MKVNDVTHRPFVLSLENPSLSLCSKSQLTKLFFLFPPAGSVDSYIMFQTQR